MRKIWIPYSDRSEIGLLEPIINRIKKNDKLDLVPTNLNDYIPSIERDENLGKVYEACYEILKEKRPDLALIGFDRREMVFCALAAHHQNLPIIHLYAGDIGTDHPDEINRMIISDLAHVMCAHSKQNAENLIKRGEEPWRVKYTGSTALDDIELISLNELTSKYNIPKEFDLVLYHPNPCSPEKTEKTAKEIFEALDKFTIILYPNKDRYHEIIIEEIEKHKNDKHIKVIKNMPRNDYLTALKYAKMAIGNSSSFVLEAPFFGTGVIHVDNRNKNRTAEIPRSGGSDKIIEILENLEINDKLLKKKYHKIIGVENE